MPVTVVTRTGKGSELTYAELDANFNNLNSGKADTVHNQAASTISDSTAAGRALLTAANAAAQRTELGLGTAAVLSSTAFAATGHQHGPADLAGTGTRNGTTFYAGDGTWKVPAAAASTNVTYAIHGSSDFPATGDGTADDTAALTTANASGKTIVFRPDKKYVIGDFVPRDGAIYLGNSPKGYQGDNRNNGPARTMIIKKAGAANIFAIDGKQRCTFADFSIDGVDRAARAFGGGGQLMSFRNLTINNCESAFGSGGTIDATYTRTCEMLFCQISDCNTGIASLIDSNILGGAVTSCLTGVHFLPGANSNNIVALRVEWCTNHGYDIYQCDTNTITGGLTDRNGKAGMRLTDMRGMLTVNGHLFRRNGATDVDGPSRTNLYLSGNSDAKARVIITGCASEVGGDDSGGGTISPRYSVGWDGTNSGVMLGMNDFRAGTVAASIGTATGAVINTTRGLTNQ